MAEDKSPDKTKSDNASGSTTRAKKEKPPAVEDKPFTEFVEQHFVPALADALSQEGVNDAQLMFEKTQLAVKGASSNEDYWQVSGRWPQGGDRRFSVVFTKEDIKGPKFFYCGQGDKPSSTVEQFMGDERKITLDLMVLYTLQRLNGQKWLARN